MESRICRKDKGDEDRFRRRGIGITFGTLVVGCAVLLALLRLSRQEARSADRLTTAGAPSFSSMVAERPYDQALGKLDSRSSLCLCHGAEA